MYIYCLRCGFKDDTQISDSDAQYRTDLPIDTMTRFEHGPIMWSGLTRANATILLTGENRSLQQDGASLK